LRVMQSDVVAIVNDVRNNVVKCQWCYGYDTDNDGKCDRCGKDDYLAPLMP
jgi:rRNA maturation endonuclease Nob1